MEIIFEFIPIFFVYLPIGAILVFIINRGLSADVRVNIIFAHSVLAVVIQLIMAIMAIMGVKNIIVMDIYIVLEMFLIVLLSTEFFNITRTKKVALAILIFILSTGSLFIFDSVHELPVYTIFFNTVVYLLIGFLTLRRINFKNKYERGFFLFVLAVLLYFIGHSSSYLLWEGIKSLTFQMQAVINITKYIIITIGITHFYKYIKEAPERVRD